MKRIEFAKKLNAEVNKIDNNDMNLFRKFMGINEISEEYLSEQQRAFKAQTLEMMEADIMMKEQYYLFHLSRTIDTKWAPIDLDKIVNHFYKNSSEIKRIYENK